MALRGFIGSKELDLPNDFTHLPEFHSSIYDYKNLRIGEYSMNLKFPFTSRNRLAFQFADELAVSSKTIRYDNFRLEEDGEIKLEGTLTLERTEEENGEGFYDCDFYTVLLPIDISKKKLSEILTKTVSLGSTTAAILSAAKAQNDAAMSTDGSTGAVMKFVPHYNPEFYGDTNPDFYPETSDFSFETSYKKGSFNIQRLAENDAARQNNANYTFVGIENYTPADGVLIPIAFDQFSNAFDQGLFATDRVTFTEAKRYKIRFVARLKNTDASTQRFITPAIRKTLVAGGNVASESVFLEPDERKVFAIQAYFDAEISDEIIITTTNGDNLIEIEEATLEVIEISKFSAQPPMRFRALEEVKLFNRETSPYWELDAAGIINDFNSISFGGFFRQNGVAKYLDDSTKPVNRQTLVPFLQVHAVIHAIGAALGYRVKGEYMRDTLEQRALLPNNFALDKSSGRSVYTYVGISNYEVPDAGLEPVPFDRFTGIFTNENAAWNTTTNKFTAAFSGWHRIRLRVTWRNNNTVDDRLTMALRRSDLSGDQYWNNSEDPFIAPEETYDTDVEIDVDLAFEDDVYLITTETVTGQFEILYAELEITHLEKDDLNVFLGDVDFKNHVPDMTAGQFLLAVKMWKNLFVTWDTKSRILYLDYAENVIKSGRREAELSDYAVVKKRIEQKPKKRYAINYEELPDDAWEPDATYEQLEPVANYLDLVPPTGAEQAVLVQNQNAWYVSVLNERARIFHWERKGSNYPDLLIEEEQEGDQLYEIKPALGPVKMALVCNQDRQVALMPVFSGAGQSTMFKPGGSPLPFQVLYWVGYDATLTGGYPLATTTKLNNAGTAVLTGDMLWQSIYQLNWKRTLECLVLEEITRNYFRFPPENKQLINFAKIFLLGHVPVIPIKTAEVSGGNGLMEIEARKVKTVDISIVNEIEDSEPVLWTPANMIKFAWFSIGDADGVEISGSDITQVNDLSGNENHLTTYSTDSNPVFDASAINGKPAASFNGTARRKKIDPFGLESFTVFHVFQFAGGNVYLHEGEPGNRFGARYFNGKVAIVADDNSNNLVGPINNSETYIGQFYYENNDSDVYIDGELLGNVNPFSRVGTSSVFYWGGGYFNGVYMNGLIAETIIVDGEVLTDVRQQIEGYLAHKYLLTAKLPIDHPYKDAAPTV